MYLSEIFWLSLIFFQIISMVFACHGEVKFPPRVNFNSIKSWMKINFDCIFIVEMLKSINTYYWSRELGSSTDFNEDFSETC